MALILNIDTALDHAFVSLAKDGRQLVALSNESQQEHAAWTHKAISDLFSKAGFQAGDLSAVGVTIGPGSYTGLRIGLSTAKGLCYALNIPLITVNTLRLLAYSAVQQAPSESADLYCPMIDARRMEVFTAIYDSGLHEVIKPQAMILTRSSFEELLKGHKILFVGNGSLKFQNICQNVHAIFKNVASNAVALATLTYRDFVGNNFAGVAYTEPLYMKEFFTRDDEPNKKGKPGSIN